MAHLAARLFRQFFGEMAATRRPSAQHAQGRRFTRQRSTEGAAWMESAACRPIAGWAVAADQATASAALARGSPTQSAR